MHAAIPPASWQTTSSSQINQILPGYKPYQVSSAGDAYGLCIACGDDIRTEERVEKTTITYASI